MFHKPYGAAFGFILSMRMKTFAILISLVLVVSYLSIDFVPSTNGIQALGIQYAVPITLTNSATTATPRPFQQMVAVNSLAYSSYEASNLQNVEFFYSTGTLIPSWLESGNSNTATKTIYWLKLSNSIPAGSSLTVYMGFAPPTKNKFDGKNVGEAPELSPQYGQYDNGKVVFQFYDNFAAGSSNSAWSITGASSWFVRNNGLSLFINPTDYYATTQTFGPGTAFDSFITQFQDTDNVGYINTGQPAFVSTNGWAGTLIRSACIDIYPDQQNGTGDANACGSSYGRFYSGIASVVGIYSVDVISPTSSVQSINYSQGSTSQPINTYSPSYPASVGFMAGNGYVGFKAQWVRVRAAPPNGSMPVVTIGIIKCPGTTGVPGVICPLG
jgi:hypothetical protein